MNRRGFVALEVEAEPEYEPVNVGDVFTIEGRYAIHPITNQPTPHLQKFIVTGVSGDTVNIIPRSETPLSWKRTRRR